MDETEELAFGDRGRIIQSKFEECYSRLLRSYLPMTTQLASVPTVRADLEPSKHTQSLQIKSHLSVRVAETEQQDGRRQNDTFCLSKSDADRAGRFSDGVGKIGKISQSSRKSPTAKRGESGDHVDLSFRDGSSGANGHTDCHIHNPSNPGFMPAVLHRHTASRSSSHGTECTNTHSSHLTGSSFKCDTGRYSHRYPTSESNNISSSSVIDTSVSDGYASHSTSLLASRPRAQVKSKRRSLPDRLSYGSTTCAVHPAKRSRGATHGQEAKQSVVHNDAKRLESNHETEADKPCSPKLQDSDYDTDCSNKSGFSKRYVKLTLRDCHYTINFIFRFCLLIEHD